MAVIRVLALNDDTHETTFHTPNTNWTLKEFVKELAKPHQSDYEIRGVYSFDIDDNDIESLVAFERIAYRCEDQANDSAFEKLWKISNTDICL